MMPSLRPAKVLGAVPTRALWMAQSHLDLVSGLHLHQRRSTGPRKSPSSRLQQGQPSLLTWGHLPKVVHHWPHSGCTKVTRHETHEPKQPLTATNLGCSGVQSIYFTLLCDNRTRDIHDPSFSGFHCHYRCCSIS